MVSLSKLVACVFGSHAVKAGKGHGGDCTGKNESISSNPCLNSSRVLNGVGRYPYH